MTVQFQLMFVYIYVSLTCKTNDIKEQQFLIYVCLFAGKKF